MTDTTNRTDSNPDERDDQTVDSTVAATTAETTATAPARDDETRADIDDIWGDALAEQATAEQDGAAAATMTATVAATGTQQTTRGDSMLDGDGAVAADDRLFQQFEAGNGNGAPRDLDVIMEIPVTLAVELGQTRLTIRQLLDLAQGSIIELDGLAGEPMDVQINGYLIAQGEVVVVDDRYGIRITDIVTPTERIHKLSH